MFFLLFPFIVFAQTSYKYIVSYQSSDNNHVYQNNREFENGGYICKHSILSENRIKLCCHEKDSEKLECEEEDITSKDDTYFTNDIFPEHIAYAFKSDSCSSDLMDGAFELLENKCIVKDSNELKRNSLKQSKRKENLIYDTWYYVKHTIDEETNKLKMTYYTDETCETIDTSKPEQEYNCDSCDEETGITVVCSQFSSLSNNKKNTESLPVTDSTEETQPTSQNDKQPEISENNQTQESSNNKNEEDSLIDLEEDSSDSNGTLVTTILLVVMFILFLL